MRLLLHALSTAEAPAELPDGLRGQRLVGVEEAGVVGWATQFAEADPKFGRSDLLAHHEIISKLHAHLDACLPVRFPTWYADEAALRAELGRRRAELNAGLDAVRGTCELAITVLWNSPAEPARPVATFMPGTTTPGLPTEAMTGGTAAPGLPTEAMTAGTAEPALPTDAMTPGTRYLHQRQQALVGSDSRRARARELAAEIERLAGADLVAVRAQVCPSATVAVSSALLARREHASELIARLPRARDDVRILVNGPWPPYSFAGTGGREA